MKSTYNAPQIIQIGIRTKHLISTSTTDQDVYTDDPQNPGGALVKDKHSIWDDEW